MRLLPFLLAGTAFALAPVAAAAEDNGKEVVVTGTRLADSERALKECIARKCPPKEDIKATLAHAENQFVAGDYHGARRTLLAGRGRDLRYGKDYPIEVADLLRATSRISAHVGESEDYRLNAIVALDVLRKGLPADDPRVLYQRLEVADADARTSRLEPANSRIDQALRTYADVARQARAIGDAKAEGYALLRRLMTFHQLALTGTGGYDDVIKQATRALTESDNPKLAEFASAARLVNAQYAARRGDTKALDTELAVLRRQGGTAQPVLVYAPPITTNTSPISNTFNGNVLNRLTTNSEFDDQWIDVSFWVEPDGSVSDAQVLRRSKGFSGGWDKEILNSVAGRRYLPLKADARTPGRFRVERYSLTAYWGQVSGTRLRQREPEARIEMIDLTAEPAAAIPS
ncbi:MAG: hypothetical protein K2X76_11400 [Sphingomonas sp.]|nr:hypothetical protein [Sphingomonas sp.]